MLGLHRKGPTVKYTSVSQVQRAIQVFYAIITYKQIDNTCNFCMLQEELKGCSGNIGYRQMWAVLREKHHLVVKRYSTMLSYYPVCSRIKCLVISA